MEPRPTSDILKTPPREGWDHAAPWLPHGLSLTGLEPGFITAELTLADLNPQMAELKPLAPRASPRPSARSTRNGHPSSHERFPTRVGDRSEPRITPPGLLHGNGKLLLAYLPEKELHELVGAMKLTKYGPNTSKKKLLAELDLIREESLAVNDQELAADLNAIPAPPRDESSQVSAAISLSAQGSTVPLEEMIEVLSP